MLFVRNLLAEERMRQISFLTYGRQTMGRDWYIAPRGGVCRLYYLHSGTVLYDVNGQELALRPHTLYLFPQNLEFRLRTDDSTCVDHTYFDFIASPAIYHSEVLTVSLAEYPLLSAAFAVLALLAEQHPYSTTNGTYRHLTANYLEGLLSLIRSEFGLTAIADPDIEEAVEYIHSHYAEKLSVKQLAARYHLETNVFIRKFKRYTNTTPYQYIKNHRVNIALSLLRRGAHTQTQIAERCGYADASALAHAIRSVVK